MKNNTEDYNDELLSEYIDTNLLNRNDYLRNIIRFLASTEGNMVCNLDGGWGTGKTVFLKTIKLLRDSEDLRRKVSVAKPAVIPKAVVDSMKSLNESFDIFYFNAWENDLSNYPLQSLVFSLLQYLPDENNYQKLANVVKKFGIATGNLIIHTVTGLEVNLSDLLDNNENIKDIYPIETKKEAAKELIEQLVPAGKRLLILVDELDRCRPSFAVEFLEVIKHFFLLDNVVFLFATNKKELAETVKKYYGNGFDGFNYLNRFFDFEFKLPIYQKEKYIEHLLQDYGFYSDSYIMQMVEEVCGYFELTLREINRYVLALKTLLNYIGKDASEKRFEPDSMFIKVVLIPYLLGVKFRDSGKFDEFLKGNGRSDFEKFMENDSDLVNHLIINELQVKRRFTQGDDEKEKIDNFLTSVFNQVKEYQINSKGFVAPERNLPVSKIDIINALNVLTMMSDLSEYE